MVPAHSSTVHHDMIAGLIDKGRVPSMKSLAASSGLNHSEVLAAVTALEEDHALVLHPGSQEVWVIPPFSLVPTGFWVENDERGWWASCIWCALGVCALVGGSTRIHTRLAAEAEEVVIEVSEGCIQPRDLLAHFPIPVERAWENVHRFCGSTLVFRSHEQIEDWCYRHGIPKGDVQPLEKIRELAARWYGGHSSPTWQKWTAAQAAKIFASLDLRGATWSLPASDTRF